MLMLIYALSTLLVFIIGSLYFLGAYFIKKHHKKETFSTYYPKVSLCVALIAVLVLFFALGKFFKFHLTMVLTNSTTIENLESKRHAGELENVKFLFT